jgi:hypothetical protein
MGASDSRTFTLGDEADRGRVASVVARCPEGWVVTIKPPQRTSGQNRLLHSALADIANQVIWHGERFDLSVWKRLCTSAWLRECGDHSLLVPALDGHGLDIIFEKTSHLSISQLSELLEWCYAFGAENGVTFKL